MDEQHIQQPVEQKKRSPINTPMAIVTAGVLVALAVIFTQPPRTTSLKNKPENNGLGTQIPKQNVAVRPTDAVRGDIETADVIIVEYSDSDCPFCERFHNTMKEIITLPNIKVAWIYRHFPLSIHPNAENEAVALECVKDLGGNNAFWNYLDSIIGMTFSPEKSTSMLTALAKDEGIDTTLFSTCIKSPAKKAFVQAQSDEAQAFGAKGTPFSVLINTKTGAQQVIPGALPTEQLTSALNAFVQ